MVSLPPSGCWGGGAGLCDSCVGTCSSLLMVTTRWTTPYTMLEHLPQKSMHLPIMNTPFLSPTISTLPFSVQCSTFLHTEQWATFPLFTMPPLDRLPPPTENMMYFEMNWRGRVYQKRREKVPLSSAHRTEEWMSISE